MCYEGVEEVNLASFQRNCTVEEPVPLNTETPSWVLPVVLGIICLLVISATIIIFRLKFIEMEKSISRRAVHRFIVPPTLSREGKVEPMEQATHLEAGSLPDLLAAVPESR